MAAATNPLRLPLAIVAVAVAVRAFGTVDADVSWQLWVAHQLNGGARLYRDVVEGNPPLWFWMAMPADALAGLIHVGPDHLLVIAVGSCAALSLAATNRMLEPIDDPRRALLMAYAALVLVAMPWLQFAQREQIAMIGALPYAALIAARRSGRPVGTRFAILVGAGAALGFALKHYFLLVPILLELWLLAGLGKRWRPLRPETIAVAAVGIAYAAAFALFARDYFSVSLPMLVLAYGVTGAERVIDLFQPAVLTGLVTLALLVAHRRAFRSDETGFAAALVVAAAGFATGYFIQAKGWSYHAVPLAGCAAIALAASLTRGTRPRFLALAAPALLMLPLWIGAQQAIGHRYIEPDVAEAVAGLHAGDSVGFIGTDPAFGWPVTLQRGFMYPSRYSSFWMMRAVMRSSASGNPDPALAAFGNRAVTETAQDFSCRPPRRIIVARPTAAQARLGAFDILEFFLRDPQFAQLLRHYRPVQRTSVEVFELVAPLPSAHDCLRRVEG
ncbi:MAG TPA: hypothetical protein VGM04_00230 [Sphingomicrobium sp.]